MRPDIAREPLLYAPPSAAQDPRAPRPAPDDNRREGLRPVPVAQPPFYRRVKGATIPLIRPQTLEDPGISSVLVGSTILHSALLAAALMAAAHHKQQGSQYAPDAQPVEMMFTAPPSRSGLAGPQSTDQAGGDSAQTDKQASNNTQDAQSAESTPSPAAPTPETPAAPPLPTERSAELPTPTAPTTPVTPAPAPSGKAKAPNTKPTHVTRRPVSTRPRHTSPFDSPMDLSFDQAPAPPRARRGRSGGAGAPIDLSVGPLVKDGQINAPYSTRTTIRGVSEDYEGEIDRWIRSHMYYPEDAARNGEDGPSSVHVVLDRSGHVKAVRLTGQSGSYSLDAATTGMFRNAQLPPVPPDMKGDHFDIDLTINYILIRR
ncbi:TonB periplasmic protein [Ameyamaea chiangmaiensis NBRC 103196]|nr:energy transducer TonB [Ameyamaea chiangmaiensis]GBQ68247.1 TonB periplasmic protein [Ameyamaea chiangmaiensis NBRC 103196]